MDALAGFLDGPRARGAFLLRASFRPPWSIRVQDESPLAVVAVAEGRLWILTDDEQIEIAAGDVAVLRGPDPYTIADDPTTAAQVIVHPGQRCTTIDGASVAEAMALGVRTWGNSAEGSAVMLVGAYERSGEISQRLLDALPPVVVMRQDDWACPVIPLLADEIGRDEPGQEVVLDRLLDLLLISVLRAWFARPDAPTPGWYRAQSDPVVGQAMRMLCTNPARPWTVASLAAAVGVSRAALARRFTELVGEPPMTFLTEWRLGLAADLLSDPDASVGSVAREVGYGTPFAFSAAFKRVRGVSPQAHRLAATG